jgi:hypothetical protein
MLFAIEYAKQTLFVETGFSAKAALKSRTQYFKKLQPGNIVQRKTTNHIAGEAPEE